MQDWSWQSLYPVLELISHILTGSLCAYLARQRGRRPFLWMILGVLFGILGIIALYILPKKHKIPTKKNFFSPKQHMGLPFPNPYPDKLWYYLDKDNQPQGAMSLNALFETWQKEKINLLTYVWNEEMEDWKPMQDIPEIMNQIEKSPPTLLSR